MLELFLLSIVVVLIYMTLIWLLSLTIKDASIVDITWGPGFIVVSLLAYCFHRGDLPLMLTSTIVLLWGSRLAIHILLRKKLHPGEDFRYAAWRKDWGNTFIWRSFLQVFMLQGAILVVLSTPILFIASSTNNLNTLSYVAAGIALAGLLCEVVADKQLTQFKKDTKNKGRLITTGLWKYSRHPNYFGESVVWWGVWGIAASLGGWWTVFSPALLTYLLLYVSGVPMLEKKYAGRSDFEEYKKRTSKFVLWFPRT